MSSCNVIILIKCIDNYGIRTSLLSSMNIIGTITLQ